MAMFIPDGSGGIMVSPDAVRRYSEDIMRRVNRPSGPFRPGWFQGGV